MTTAELLANLRELQRHEAKMYSRPTYLETYAEAIRVIEGLGRRGDLIHHVMMASMTKLGQFNRGHTEIAVDAVLGKLFPSDANA